MVGVSVVYGLRALLTRWSAVTPVAALLDPRIAPNLRWADFPWVDCVAMVVGFGVLPLAHEAAVCRIPWREIGLRVGGGRGIPAGVGVGVLLWAWGHAVARMLGLPMAHTMTGANALVLGVAWSCTVGAEEVLFRAIIQRRLTRSVGLPLALVAASLLFAFVGHLQANPWANLLLRVPAGLALGRLYNRTGSLLPSVIGHWVFNVLAALG